MKLSGLLRPPSGRARVALLYEEFGWLSDMFNFKSTGLPGRIVIWTSMRGSARWEPCIRVSNRRGRFSDPCCDSGGAFAMTVAGVPKVVAGMPRKFSSKEMTAIRQWIFLNRKLLLERWVSETMSSHDFFLRMRSLRKWKSTTAP